MGHRPREGCQSRLGAVKRFLAYVISMVLRYAREAKSFATDTHYTNDGRPYEHRM